MFQVDLKSATLNACLPHRRCDLTDLPTTISQHDESP